MPADILTAARPLDQLPARVQAALAEAGAARDGRWTVAGTQPDMVLFRELAEPDASVRPSLTHAMVRLTPSRDGTMEDPLPGQPWQWRISGSTHCALELISGIDAIDRTDAGPQFVTGHLALDPTSPPDPSSHEVTLEVRFTHCDDEHDVVGGWRVLHVREDARQIEVVVGARAVPPGPPDEPVPAVCNGSNSVASAVVELDAPLGDRVLVDPTVLPVRRLERLDLR